MSTRYTSKAADAVLLSWSCSERPAKFKRHRATLEQLARAGRCVWIRLADSFSETRFQLTSVEHTFPASVGNETIRRELGQWRLIQNNCLDRIYLVAQEHVKETCYDITDYIDRCLTGDYSIANRLSGRTIFGLRQIETDAHDLLSSQGTSGAIDHVLRPYIHEFGDFIGNTILGFCCQLPSFLSPLKTPALTVPWSPNLKSIFQSIWEERLTEHLPLIFYGTHGAAAVRSVFWERVTQEFSQVCIGGIRDFCHRLGLQCSIEIPAGDRSLGFDLGTILKYSDGTVLVDSKGSTDSNNSHDTMEKSRTASRESLRCSVPNLFPINSPKQFLIAKWVASRRSTAASQTIGVWRSRPPTTVQFAFDRVLGFNSWIANESESADSRGSECKLNHASLAVDSQSPPLKQGKKHLSNSVCLMGEPQRPALIISPVQSLWSRTDERAWSETTDSWAWLCQVVWNLGYDFDIAAERDFINAKFYEKSRLIRVNNGFYQVVLIPSCASLQESTVGLLTEVVAGRGKLIAVDPVPYLLNSKVERDTRPLELLLYNLRTSRLRGTAAEKTETLKQILRKRIKPVLRVYAKPDNILTDSIKLQHRRTETLDLFFLVNATPSSIEGLIEIKGESVKVEEWETTSSEKSDMDFWHADGNTYLNCSFDCWQSRLVTTRRKVKTPLS